MGNQTLSLLRQPQYIYQPNRTLLHVLSLSRGSLHQRRELAQVAQDIVASAHACPVGACICHASDSDERCSVARLVEQLARIWLVARNVLNFFLLLVMHACEQQE
jgi:hypothetical protein